MKVRRYSHVMHLEAAVTGTLAPGRTALDATLSCFPAGTLSGAPKVRAMEIIDALEVSRRGLYGGVVGYFDFAGDSDTAIAIRTAVIRDDVAYVQAGAGVVADSIPARRGRRERQQGRRCARGRRRGSSADPARRSEVLRKDGRNPCLQGWRCSRITDSMESCSLSSAVPA